MALNNAIISNVGRVINIILSVIIVLAVVVIYLPKILWQAQMFSVNSGSMEPEIPVGSMVIVVPASFDEIKVDDIVTFRLTTTVVTHKVVEKYEESRMIRTQGIASETADAPIRAVHVMGVVKYHVAKLGYVLDFLSGTHAKIICITVIVALWLISLLLSRLKYEEEQKQALPTQAEAPAAAPQEPVPPQYYQPQAQLPYTYIPSGQPTYAVPVAQPIIYQPPAAQPAQPGTPLPATLEELAQLLSEIQPKPEEGKAPPE
ncbi:MAG: signal peptidase I [Clostridium sp.]|jgi:signal peptidase I|nr:signal peptidase I [Clostridium sp.]